jgi:Protein of unknown function (DUF2587)
LGETVNYRQIAQPGKVSWIASLIKQLREEVKVAPLGPAGRLRVSEIHSRAGSKVEQSLALGVVNELRGITLQSGDSKGSDTRVSVSPDRYSSRADRLLSNIETAQFGQQRQRQRRRQAHAGTARGRDRLGYTKP